MLGGRIIEHCAVNEIRAAHGKVESVATAQGDFRADTYIVAAGAWSRNVLGAHGGHLEIKPMRGQMLLFHFDAPPLSRIVLQGDLYLIPRRDGHLLIGSTLEDVGFDKRTTEAAYDTLRRRAEAILPPLRDMPLIRHWAGLRPGSPGNIPFIDRHPQLENLYINAGHFRYGVTMAPASVEVLLEKM
jgi:glycine oxidase